MTIMSGTALDDPDGVGYLLGQACKISKKQPGRLMYSTWLKSSNGARYAGIRQFGVPNQTTATLQASFDFVVHGLEMMAASYYCCDSFRCPPIPAGINMRSISKYTIQDERQSHVIVNTKIEKVRRLMVVARAKTNGSHQDHHSPIGALSQMLSFRNASLPDAI